MPRFFMAGTNILGGTAIMTGKDAKHVQVLRMRPGEDMIICDGKGTDYKCRLVLSDKEKAEAEVVEVVRCPAEPSVKVTVLCGLPKGDKTDYIIQKCVEAGASEIVFFDAERCVAKSEGDKLSKKLERWNRISEEAAKQSGRGVIPPVSWAKDLGEVFNIAVHRDLALFMYEAGEREGMDTVLDAHKDIQSAAIITGPEGGFAEFEVQLAKSVGLHICSMGERILRCETAPLVALTAVMYATGNLG